MTYAKWAVFGRKLHIFAFMTDKSFNKWFSAFILAGMTVAIVLATSIKIHNAGGADLLLVISAFGSLMGVAATVCSANGKIVTFLFGLLDVSIYGAVCLVNWRAGSSGLGNAVLHLAYFVPMQFIGYAQWMTRGKSSDGSLKARRLNSRQRLIYAGLFLAGSVCSYIILAQFDRSAAEGLLKIAIVLDVLPLVCNILGQHLMSMAYMEQWVFWIGVNVFSICMWSVSLSRMPDSSYALVYIIKYSFYLINSLNGLRNWIRMSR